VTQLINYCRGAGERRSLPKARWSLLLLGTLLLLSVYYLIYDSEFEEGSVEGVSPLALPLRAISVFLIASSLAPFRLRQRAPVALIVLYLLSACSLAIAIGFSGELNDRLFLNTILQLPVLWALCQTKWAIDHVRLLRFIGACLIVQSCIDLAVMMLGQSLWLSEAFVGGFGNPSSFGLACVVLSAFFLFHPEAGRCHLLKAVALSLAAIMSKSLFAVLCVGIIFIVWALRDIRRTLAGAVALVFVAVGVNAWLSAHDEQLFILHKLSAAGAFVGLIDYDVDSATSVSARSDMHQRTFSAIADEPVRFVLGHLEGKVYWPMDSQALTYLGSFGIVMLFSFLALHATWMLCALRNRAVDGGFAFIALGVFGAIFLTNRILDYFPVATIYFLCIAMATTNYPEHARVRFLSAHATDFEVATRKRWTID